MWSLLKENHFSVGTKRDEKVVAGVKEVLCTDHKGLEVVELSPSTSAFAFGRQKSEQELPQEVLYHKNVNIDNFEHLNNQ